MSNTNPLACAACGAPTTGEYSIHRDGYDKGPVVELCDACGGDPNVLCEDLFAMIRSRMKRNVSTMDIPITTPREMKVLAESMSTFPCTYTCTSPEGEIIKTISGVGRVVDHHTINITTDDGTCYQFTLNKKVAP